MVTTIFDVTPVSSTDEVLQAVMELVGWHSGSTDYGVPFYGGAWNGLDDGGTLSADYAYNWTVGEPTQSRLFNFVDANGDRLLAGDINGLNGDRPVEFTSTLHVEGNVLFDALLDVLGDTHLLADLVVDLTTTLTGIVGVGQAPAASVALGVTGKQKNTGDVWITSKLGVGEDAATDALRVTGLTSVAGNIVPRTDNSRTLGTSSLQWSNIYTEGLTADSPTLVVDATNHRVGSGTASPAYAFHAEGDFAVDVNTAIPTFFVLDASHYVAVLTATPHGAFDVKGGVLIEEATIAGATTGKHLELHYSTADDLAWVLSIDRTTATHKDLRFQAEAIVLRSRGTERYRVDQTGMSWFAVASVGQQAAPATVAGTADATYGTTERDMLNDLVTAVNAHTTALTNYGLEA